MKRLARLVLIVATLLPLHLLAVSARADNTPRFDAVVLAGKMQPVALSGTVTLDFASANAGLCSTDLVVVMSGAAAGDAVAVGPPAASVNTGSVFSGWVSAANTVKLRHCNFTASGNDPASGSYVVVVMHQPSAPAAISTATATPTATATATATNTPTNTPTP